MMRKVVLVATCLTLFGGFTHAGWANDYPGLPLDTVTDFLHSLIEAGHAFYPIHVVQLIQQQGSITASETWRKDNLATTGPVSSRSKQPGHDDRHQCPPSTD